MGILYDEVQKRQGNSPVASDTTAKGVKTIYLEQDAFRPGVNQETRFKLTDEIFTTKEFTLLMLTLEHGYRAMVEDSQKWGIDRSEMLAEIESLLKTKWGFHVKEVIR